MSIADKKELTAAIRRYFDFIFTIPLLTQFIYWFPKWFDWSEIFGALPVVDLPALSSLVILLPLYFLTTRLEIIFDVPKKRSFSALGRVNLFGRLKFIFMSKDLWIKLAAFAALYILLPMKWSFSALQYWLMIGDRFWDKLPAAAALLGIFFVLEIPANLLAMRFWRQNSDEEFYTCTQFVQQHSAVASIFLLIGFLMNMFAPLLYYMWPLIKRHITAGNIIKLILILLIPTFYRIIRAVLKRKSCIKGIIKTCEQNGYAISKISKPYLSAVFCFKGESFTVTADGKEYSCKLIGALRRRRPLVIHQNGVAGYINLFKLQRAVIWCREKKRRFGYESDKPKILIVNPTSYKLCAAIINGRAAVIDNGAVLGGYKVFTATAFINALGRGCLDR